MSPGAVQVRPQATIHEPFALLLERHIRHLVVAEAVGPPLGVLTPIWAEVFDHSPDVPTCVIAPLALLSGTFYSVDNLAPAFRAFSRANPFFYIISGFRYGFLGTADSPVLVGSVVILAIDVVLGVLCYVLLRQGWKLKS